MASIALLSPKIFKWEGGFVDDPFDHGGATNMGVTISTWRQVGYDKDGDGDIDVDDIKLLTRSDATIVLKKYYWDRWHADYILNQPIAEILVDWIWASGKWAIIIPQQLLGVPADGLVGPLTINKINSINPGRFHSVLYQARTKFLNDLVLHVPSQKRFIRGWKRRLADFKDC
jgi:lysozyme family protein